MQKYLKLSKAKDESERVYLRALVALLDNFHFPMEEVVVETETADDNEGAQEDVEGMEGVEAGVESTEDAVMAAREDAA